MIILTAFGTRLFALFASADIAPLFDEKNYLLRAEHLLNGDGFVGSYQSWVRHDESPYIADLPQYKGTYQPPFYAVFVAAIFSISGHSVLAVKFAQTVLGTLTVLMVYWIARSWFNQKAGLIAAAYCAVYPNLIAFTHYLWTETLFTFLILLAIGFLTTREGLPSRKRCVAAGCTLAIASLTRAAILYFAPFLLAWLVVSHARDRSRAIGRSALVGLALLAILAPWIVRNYQVHDALVLVDTNGPYNVWRGNAGKKTFKRRPHEPSFSYDAPFQSIPLLPVRENREPELIELARKQHNVKWPTDLQVTETASKEAIKSIRSDLSYFAYAGCIKLIDMWNPTSFLIRHFRLGRYGPVNPTIRRTIEWSAIITYVCAMLFAFPGLLLHLRNRHTWLIVMMVGYFCAIHAIAFGLTRFRLPLMPFIIMLAAAGIAAMFASNEDDEPNDEGDIADSYGGESLRHE
ncbi:MAG: hypothetical protein DHS20C16_01560 [Phycisphaerae bacterium]|nr:MAG: hypothetical protein DHS20C16_01560 [Phycisphaerae bacterium]